MLLFNIGRRLIEIGFVFFIMRNIWFGWNVNTDSLEYVVMDIVNTIIFYAGFLLYLIPLHRIYENYVSFYFGEEKKPLDLEKEELTSLIVQWVNEGGVKFVDENNVPLNKNGNVLLDISKLKEIVDKED